jgi:squalene synthase HpnC
MQTNSGVPEPDSSPLAIPADVLRAHERSENFPVALRLLPRRYREDLGAVYAFARGVDEIGDSATGRRADALRAVDTDIDRTWAGEPVTDPVLAGLATTVVEHGIPAEPFHHLVAANVQDQLVHRYETFADLRGYCRLSADPVGRIVLAVFGQASPTAIELSDRVCTALQLLEHWQDVAEDRRAGRVYLPLEDLRAFGVEEGDLDRPDAGPAVTALLRFEIDRAARLLEDGSGIVHELRGWARVSVAGFVAGGRATVAALRATGGDVLSRSVVPSASGTAARLVALLASATVHDAVRWCRA